MNTKQFSVMQLLAAFILGVIVSGLIVFATIKPQIITETIIETQVVTVEKPVFYPQLGKITGKIIDGDKEVTVFDYNGEEYLYENFIIVEEDEENKEVNEAEEVSTSNVSTSNSSIFNLTAYCPCKICCGEYANGITATGTVATANRTIAVDPNVIPYGTHVLINGVEYVAEDCGGAIQGNRIDVYFDTHQEALNFGRQTAEVTILN